MAGLTPYKNEQEESMYEFLKEGKTFEEISELQGICFEETNDLLQRMLVEESRSGPKPKEVLDENFFEKIDSVDKAYFFGLIASDGSIVFQTNSGFLTITLEEDDSYILEEFTKSLKTNKTVSFIDRSSHTYKHDYNVKNSCRYYTYNRKIVFDLLKKGIVPKKSMTIKDVIRFVDKEYRLDFIRGYFDGNGCVSNTVKTSSGETKFALNFTGNKECLDGIKSELSEYGIALKSNVRWLTSTRQYVFNIGAQDDVKSFRDLIYHQHMENYFLNRKYHKFPW